MRPLPRIGGSGKASLSKVQQLERKPREEKGRREPQSGGKKGGKQCGRGQGGAVGASRGLEQRSHEIASRSGPRGS